MIFSSVWSRNDVHMIDLDEVTTRVVIGVLSDESVPLVRENVSARGIPNTAVEIVVAPQSIPLQSLDSHQRPITGGWLVQHSGACTLGWTAYQNGIRYAVVASHCTEDTYSRDASAFWQWNVSNNDHLIGSEAKDLTGFGVLHGRYRVATAMRRWCA